MQQLGLSSERNWQMTRTNRILVSVALTVLFCAPAFAASISLDALDTGAIVGRGGPGAWAPNSSHNDVLMHYESNWAGRRRGFIMVDPTNLAGLTSADIASASLNLSRSDTADPTMDLHLISDASWTYHSELTPHYFYTFEGVGGSNTSVANIDDFGLVAGAQTIDVTSFIQYYVDNSGSFANLTIGFETDGGSWYNLGGTNSGDIGAGIITVETAGSGSGETPVAEPVGLGLLGVAALALRKRRS
jgi:hypothetical protein